MIASYTREFVKAGKIYDWGKIRNDPAHPEFNQWFKESDWEYVKFQNVYMYAPREAAVDGLYYNTELFTANGWQPPKTFADLLDLCKKATAKGLNAISIAGKDVRFAWLASCLMLRTAGADNLKALALGDQKTAKWNDPKYGFVDMMTKYKEMVDAKVFPDGCLGSNVQDAANLFSQGKTLMYYEGAFRVNDFLAAGGDAFVQKVKIVPFPSIDGMPNATPDYIVGGPTSGMMISNGLGDYKTAEVVNLVKGYLSPDYQVPGMEMGGSLYAGQAKYDTSKFKPVLNELMMRFREAKEIGRASCRETL